MSEVTEAIVNQAIAAYNRGLSDGQAIEQERIIKLLLDGWVRDENAPIIKAIKGEQK
jgi:hypothetical protein